MIGMIIWKPGFNKLSTAVKLTNQLLCFWTDEWFVLLQKSPQSVFCDDSHPIFLCNIILCNWAAGTRTGGF